MRKSKNGFIAISIIYSFFLVFVLLILLIISTLIANRNNDNIYILDIKERLSTEYNSPSLDKEIPSCILKVSGSFIAWQEKIDDVGITIFGLDKVQNSTNGKEFFPLDGFGTYYGTVVDSAGHKGSCSVDVRKGKVQYKYIIICEDGSGETSQEYTSDEYPVVNSDVCRLNEDSVERIVLCTEDAGYVNAKDTDYCYKNTGI